MDVLMKFYTLSARWASLPAPKESLREKTRIMHRDGFTKVNDKIALIRPLGTFSLGEKDK